ncbi:MAG: hypothetical protein U0893_15735 [Chloroflexota bacterium]
MRDDERSISILARDLDVASWPRLEWLDDDVRIEEERPAGRLDLWEDWALLERLSQPLRLLFGP